MYSHDVERETAAPPVGPDPERTWSCERPLPHVRGDRKWVAPTYCDRCELPLP
jgi:hypothetical protein